MFTGSLVICCTCSIVCVVTRSSASHAYQKTKMCTRVLDMYCLLVCGDSSSAAYSLVSCHSVSTVNSITFCGILVSCHSVSTVNSITFCGILVSCHSISTVNSITFCEILVSCHSAACWCHTILQHAGVVSFDQHCK